MIVFNSKWGEGNKASSGTPILLFNFWNYFLVIRPLCFPFLSPNIFTLAVGIDQLREQIGSRELKVSILKLTALSCLWLIQIYQ